MLKKLLLAVCAFLATMSLAFAQVDVNKADQAALDSVKGIGPKMSKTIIDERSKNGAFKDWDDFQKRVKGVGEKNSDKLSQAGLTVDGKAKPNAPAAKADSKAKGRSKDEAKAAGDGSAAAAAKLDAKAPASTPAMPKAETRADTKAAGTAKDAKKDESRK